MGFLDKLGQKLKEEATRLAKPPSASGIGAEKLLEHFEPADEKVLEEKGEAMLSFFRERCIRGNARKFRIFLDGQEACRIRMEDQCGILCEPGFRRVYVKLDTLTSSVLNLKAEAGKRYYFVIACTMEDGMILKQIEGKREKRRSCDGASFGK